MVRVLNASRRHRLGHAARRCALPGRGRVLNASRRHRLGHGRRRCTLRREFGCSTPLGVTDLVTRRWRGSAPAGAGAQRLSASQTWSQDRRRVRRARPSGAQRLSASQTWSRRRPLRRRSRSDVLNASRRHRLGHVSGRPRRCRAQRVLNASRRHRLGHAVQSIGDAGRARVCSTPLGVTDLVTLASDWRPTPFEGAQRLSASQTWSR